MKEEIISFLYKSIDDCQNTIRAIDTKMGFLFAVVFLPIVGLEDIQNVFLNISNISRVLFYISILVFILWISSLYMLFITTIAISNPSETIKGEQPENIFHNSNLYEFKKFHIIANFSSKSKKSIEQNIKCLPSSNDEMVNILMFEKMKLTYIREIKTQRSRLCSTLVFVWLLLGTILWSVYLLHNGI